MNGKIATYNIEFVDAPFSNQHRKCSTSVIVSVFIENKIVAKNTYGLLTKEELYSEIESNKSVNIDNCYIKNFSVEELKSTVLKIDNSVYLSLNDFSAQSTFFDCTLGVDFSLVNFTKGVNFNNSIFSHGNVSFFKSTFGNYPITFNNVSFGNGAINFQYANFGNKDVSFSNSIFYGGLVSFVNANFNNGRAYFNNINFNNAKVKFHYAKFGEGDINFQKSRFGNQTVDFRRVEFGSGKVDFRRTTFGSGYVTFDEAELKSGKFNFKLARFGNNDISFKQLYFKNSELHFENVIFGSGYVSFNKTDAKKISFKGARIDVYLDLRVNACEEIDLSDAISRDIIDLQPSTNDVKINTLYLHGMRNLGRFIIDWSKNNVKQLIKSQTTTSYNQKSEQFNILKENFHLSGQYEEEDKAYIQFKRYEQRYDVKTTLEKGGSSLIKIPYYIFRWIVFDKMGLYATSPLRVLFSMIVIYVLFSLTYTLLPYFDLGSIVNSVGATDGLNFLQTSFYHSAITFLTIGYGDYYPTGITRGISIVEGWTGLFLMSYFTVAFVRKILR